MQRIAAVTATEQFFLDVERRYSKAKARGKVVREDGPAPIAMRGRFHPVAPHTLDVKLTIDGWRPAMAFMESLLTELASLGCGSRTVGSGRDQAFEVVRSDCTIRVALFEETIKTDESASQTTFAPMPIGYKSAGRFRLSANWLGLRSPRLWRLDAGSLASDTIKIATEVSGELSRAEQAAALAAQQKVERGIWMRVYLEQKARDEAIHAAAAAIERSRLHQTERALETSLAMDRHARLAGVADAIEATSPPGSNGDALRKWAALIRPPTASPLQQLREALEREIESGSALWLNEPP